MCINYNCVNYIQVGVNKVSYVELYKRKKILFLNLIQHIIDESFPVCSRHSFGGKLLGGVTF